MTYTRFGLLLSMFIIAVVGLYIGIKTTGLIVSGLGFLTFVAVLYIYGAVLQEEVLRRRMERGEPKKVKILHHIKSGTKLNR